VARCERCGRQIAYLRGEGRTRIEVEPNPVFVVPGEGRRQYVTVGCKEIRGIQTRKDNQNAILVYIPHRMHCGNPVTQHEIRKQRDRAAILRPKKPSRTPRPQPDQKPVSRENREQIKLF